MKNDNKNENGKIEKYMIRFICKTKFNLTVRSNITIEKTLIVI